MKHPWKDQCGRLVDIPVNPQRIISLVPSQTELLYALGLGERVVGITRFCTHPRIWHQTKTRVGGTKDADLAKIRQLHPDLIIGNKEENDRNSLRLLSEEFPVWISDVKTLDDALGMMNTISGMTGCHAKGGAIVADVSRNFQSLQKSKTVRAAYLIWHNPMMTINVDTFIHDMLQRAGFENVFRDRTESRYPEITAEDLRQADPEVIMLSSEPYPFRSKHISDYQTILPEAEIRFVDGRNWSWYGSALLEFDPMK